MSAKKRLLLAAVVLLLLLGALRSILFVTHIPVYGYANNFDMYRIQDCFNMDYKGHGQDRKGTPAAPFDIYQLLNNKTDHCYKTSEYIFVAVTAFIAKHGFNGEFSIRVMGLVHALSLLLLGLLIVACLWKEGCHNSALLFSSLYFIVGTDPGNTLFFNTFYAEFSGLFFITASLSFIYLYSKNDQYLIPVAVSIIGLGFSKPQNILLPAAILIIFFLYRWRHVIKNKFEILALLLLITVTFHFQLNNNGNNMTVVKKANIANTVYSVILPISDSVERAAQALKIPNKCLINSGKTWYTLLESSELCTSLTTKRKDLAIYLLSQPIMIFRMINLGLNKIDSWIVTHLGHVEGGKKISIEGRVMSINPFISFLVGKSGIPPLYAFIAPLPFYILFLARIKRPIKNDIDNVVMMICLTGACAQLIFVSSLLGDGLVEFDKHNYLYFPLLSTSILLMCLFAILKTHEKVLTAWSSNSTREYQHFLRK